MPDVVHWRGKSFPWTNEYDGPVAIIDGSGSHQTSQTEPSNSELQTKPKPEKGPSKSESNTTPKPEPKLQKTSKPTTVSKCNGDHGCSPTEPKGCCRGFAFTPEACNLIAGCYLYYSGACVNDFCSVAGCYGETIPCSSFSDDEAVCVNHRNCEWNSDTNPSISDSSPQIAVVVLSIFVGSLGFLY